MNSKNKKRIKTINHSTEQSEIIPVNNIVASDRVPFGGVKKSDFRRELSRYGMLEFTNIKSVRLYEELVSKHHAK